MIHSDFEKDLHLCETIAYADLLVCAVSPVPVSLARCGMEGEEYVVQVCDVMEFKTFV